MVGRVVGVGTLLSIYLLTLNASTFTSRLVGVGASGVNLILHTRAKKHLCRSCLNGHLGGRSSLRRLPGNVRTCLARNVRSCFRPTVRVIRGSTGPSLLLGCISRRDRALRPNIGGAAVALRSSGCPMAIGLGCITCAGRSVVGACARVDRHRGGPIRVTGCTSTVLRFDGSSCCLARFSKS